MMARYRFLMVMMVLATALTLGLSSIGAQAGLPGAVTLVTPANNVSVNLSRPIFAWTIASGATDYRLQIFDANWVQLRYQVYTPLQAGCGNGRCSVISPIGLTNGQSYRWKVYAKNATGTTQTTARMVTIALGDPKAAEMLTLVNQARCAAGRVPLRLETNLTHAARLHSARMVLHNFFAHDDPYSTLDPFERMRGLGYNYTYAGENIAAGNSTVSATFTQWWNSTGHRNNMMNTNHREMGLGYWQGGGYGHYWTMTLGTRSGATGGICP